MAPISDPAILRLLARLTRDRFAFPVDDTIRAGQRTRPAFAIPVARGRNGSVVLWGVQDTADGSPRLALMSELPPRSPALVEVLAAVAMELVRPAGGPVGEALPDSVLKGWERVGEPQSGTAGTSDSGTRGEKASRVLWLLVLVLIGVEWWVRRRSAASSLSNGGPDELA